MIIENEIWSKDFDKYDVSTIIYIQIVKSFFQKSIQFAEPVWWIDFFPRLIYKPIMPFERARNQGSLFLYQPYITYVEEVYSAYILMQQKIEEDYCFEIINKKQILKSLDKFGLNQKNLFADFDNIARYIVRKYEEDTTNDQ